jgi:hypothetical protein
VVSRPAASLSQASLTATTIPLEDLANVIARCGEVLLDPLEPSPPSSESGPEPDKPWAPSTPPSTLVVLLAQGGQYIHGRLKVVGSVLGLTPGGGVATQQPIQSGTWVHPQYVPMQPPPPPPASQRAQLSARGQEPEPSTLPAPQIDPRARCS